MFRPLLALLILALSGCGTQQVTQLAQAHAPNTRPLVHFPADQGAHPKDHNEWWYVVGHVHDGADTFGYEVTVFRLSHLNIPGAPTGNVTLYRTDVAITDETHHRFYHHIQYLFPGSASAARGRLDLHAGQVSLHGPAAAMVLHATFPAGSIALHLHNRRPAMDVGGRGYLRFGTGFTYYYSLTDIAASGTLRVHGHLYPVTGISWLDHQWGNWSWWSIRGWIWMALQLRDGTQLSVFNFRGAAGNVRAASVLEKSGRLRTVSDVHFAPLGFWRSPHDGANYPIDQQVTIPSLHASLHVIPTVRDQEMSVPSQPQGSYWEGSGRVSGTFEGKRVTGWSYTELTGYTKGTPTP